MTGVDDWHRWLILTNWAVFTYCLQTDRQTDLHWYLLSRYRDWKGVLSSIGVWACIGAETSAHRNVLTELTSKSGNISRGQRHLCKRYLTETTEIPRPLVKNPIKPPKRKQQNFSQFHTSVYWALFSWNLFTELINPLRNTFGLAELQLLIYFGQ